MNVDEIKAAIEAEKPSLREAFLKYAEEKGIEITTPTFAEAWRASEWCLRQLKARGLPHEQALAIRNAGNENMRRLGIYESVRDCLYGPVVVG